MEKVGKIGWFLTNEEMEDITNDIEVIRRHVDDLTRLLPGWEDGENITDDGNGTLPYTPPNTIDINTPCPENCPWKNPNPNIGDWTWRPWQAPWYRPGVPPQKYEVGDGRWWENQPYCTSTTDDNPNAVKDTKTNGDNEGPVWENERH